jgi:hypothetical protein
MRLALAAKFGSRSDNVVGEVFRGEQHDLCANHVIMVAFLST